MARLNRIWIAIAVMAVLNSGIAVSSSHASGIHQHNQAADILTISATQAGRIVNFPVGGLNYSPADITILVGEDVEWKGSFSSHPLVSDDSLWPTQGTGTSFTFRFNTPGVYRYHCAIHGAAGGIGMSGVVRVIDVNARVSLPLLAN